MSLPPGGVPPEKICGCEAHFSAVQEVLAMEGKPNNLHPLENGKDVYMIFLDIRWY